MADDPVPPPASDTNLSQTADDQNRPEPQADVSAPASESANSQPETPVASEPMSPEPAETPTAPSAPEAPQSPEMPPTEPASVSTQPETADSGNTAPAQTVSSEVPPETPQVQPILPTTKPQNQSEAEANPPQDQPSPKPASDQQVEIPIPPLHYPFYGSYPISFDFGAVSDDETIKKKYQEWGILGHDGVDFAVPEGTEVLSCDEGVVTQTGDNGDFGISVTIKHSWGSSIYCHLQSFGVLVNDHISKAQIIGLSDHTGFVTGPHLHFGIQPNDVNVNNGYLGHINPNPYLSETSEKPQSPPQPEPMVQPQPENPPAPADIPITPQQPKSPNEEIEKQATAMFDARQKENSIKGNQAKKAKRDEALQKIFSFTQAKKKVTNEQVRDLLHVSQSTASLYLTELVNRGMLKTEGKGKATVYLY